MEEALADFGDGRGVGLGEAFRLVPVKAWDRYNDRQREERAILSRPRHQANMIHGYMEHQARVALGDHRDVVFAPPTMQALYFDVLGKWRIQLHLFNDNLTIQHNTTGRAIEYIEQIPSQLELALGEPPTNLHLGYRLNSARSGLASVHLVCPKNAEAAFWHYMLVGTDLDGPILTPTALPVGPGPRLREGSVDAPRRTGEESA